MKEGPSGSAIRSLIPSHCKLLALASLDLARTSTELIPEDWSAPGFDIT